MMKKRIIVILYIAMEKYKDVDRNLKRILKKFKIKHHALKMKKKRTLKQKK